MGVSEALGVDVPSANIPGDDAGDDAGPEVWRGVFPTPRLARTATNTATKKIDTITGIMRGIFANFLRGDGVPGNDEDGSISDSSGSICPSTQSSIRWQLEVCGELRLNDCHGMARRHVLALLACCSQHTSILLLPTHTGRTKPLCVLKASRTAAVRKPTAARRTTSVVLPYGAMPDRGSLRGCCGSC